MTGMTDPDWVEWVANTLASVLLWVVLGTQVRIVLARQRQMQRLQRRARFDIIDQR